MALWKVSVKQNISSNRVKLEKGMSVEVQTKGISPMMDSDGKKAIIQMMSNKYGFDLEKEKHLVCNSYFEAIKM